MLNCYTLFTLLYLHTWRAWAAAWLPCQSMSTMQWCWPAGSASDWTYTPTHHRPGTRHAPPALWPSSLTSDQSGPNEETLLGSSHKHKFNSRVRVIVITSHTEDDGRLRFRRRRYVGWYIGIYVCEQLPGANSSPIVTKLRQSYPWPHWTGWIKVLHLTQHKTKTSYILTSQSRKTAMKKLNLT